MVAVSAAAGKLQGYEYTSDAPAAGAHVSAPAEVDWTLHDEGAFPLEKGIFSEMALAKASLPSLPLHLLLLCWTQKSIIFIVFNSGIQFWRTQQAHGVGVPYGGAFSLATSFPQGSRFCSASSPLEVRYCWSWAT